MIKRFRVLIPLVVVVAGASTAAQAQVGQAGRLLASNCFQCHGYNGKSSIGFEQLTGHSSSEIYKELLEMRNKVPPQMMDMHARGYSDAQIRLIADYLSKQR